MIKKFDLFYLGCIVLIWFIVVVVLSSCGTLKGQLIDMQGRLLVFNNSTMDNSEIKMTDINYVMSLVDQEIWDMYHVSIDTKKLAMANGLTIEYVIDEFLYEGGEHYIGLYYPASNYIQVEEGNCRHINNILGHELLHFISDEDRIMIKMVSIEQNNDHSYPDMFFEDAGTESVEAQLENRIANELCNKPLTNSRNESIIP